MTTNSMTSRMDAMSKPVSDDKLRALAEGARQRTEDDDYPWYGGTADIYTVGNDPDAPFIAACSPDAVLALLARLERLEAIEAAARIVTINDYEVVDGLKWDLDMNLLRSALEADK